MDEGRFPLFREMMAHEVILEPGDVLYIPSNWIHYIISLGTNYQCNTRSGVDNKGKTLVEQCVRDRRQRD